jgi:enoyl-CoA hydratase
VIDPVTNRATDPGNGTGAVLLVDEPSLGVRRLTLDRPHKRNAISNQLRTAILDALHDADASADARVVVIRGAGVCFSSGYDISTDLGEGQPYYTSHVGHQWARHVSEGWMSIWDLAIPVIAQVHGYAMAGGLELVGACDLAYAADDAQLSHPVVRIAGLPDFSWFPAELSTRHAMELQLTGRAYSGVEAAAIGLVNSAHPADLLEERVLEIASRIASSPPDVVAVNKYGVRLAQEMRQSRTAIRASAALQAGPHMRNAPSQDEVRNRVEAINRNR